jgi:hypothetical protein
MDLPLVSFGSVFHIGTMDAADKGARGSSLEGHGLSIAASEELAERWCEIAKLGGYPTWRLDKPDARFVNAHRLSKAQRKEIADWGVQEGYVERVTVWHAVRWDDESDEETWSVHESKEDAELELDEGNEIRRRRDLKGTTLLDELVGQKTGLACFDLLLVAYVQETTALDGIYWDDLSDGWYSAPRGVILPGKVGEWQVKKISEPQLRPELTPLTSPPLPVSIGVVPDSQELATD